MRSLAKRLGFSAFAAFTALATAGAASDTRAPELSAEVACRAEPSTRRVLCALALAAEVGRRVTWADAVVLAAPAASPPLRARVTSRRDAPDKLVVSFVLGEAAGRVELLARAVDCPVTGDGACRATTLPLAVELPALSTP